MPHTVRPENRCRGGGEPLPALHALHALRSEAFAEDLAEPEGPARAASRNGTMPAPWWRKVFNAQSFKVGGVAGRAAAPGWGGRPA